MAGSEYGKFSCCLILTNYLQAETSVLQISDLMDCQISLQAAIEMPFEIRELNSGTHRLKYKVRVYITFFFFFMLFMIYTKIYDTCFVNDIK